MGTTSSLLANHVTLRVRCVDRLLDRRVPAPARVRRWASRSLHRASLIGTRNIPSPALLAKNHDDRMVADFDRLAERHELPVVRFEAKESKEAIARPYQLAQANQGREVLAAALSAHGSAPLGDHRPAVLHEHAGGDANVEASAIERWTRKSVRSTRRNRLNDGAPGAGVSLTERVGFPRLEPWRRSGFLHEERSWPAARR